MRRCNCERDREAAHERRTRRVHDGCLTEVRSAESTRCAARRPVARCFSNSLMEIFSDPANWLALGTLLLLEIVLGIDNIVFISILAGKLPVDQRKRARILGLSLALITRILLLFHDHLDHAPDDATVRGTRARILGSRSDPHRPRIVPHCEEHARDARAGRGRAAAPSNEGEEHRWRVSTAQILSSMSSSRSTR